MRFLVEVPGEGSPADILTEVRERVLASPLGSRIALEQHDEALVVDLGDAPLDDLLASLAEAPVDLRLRNEETLLALIAPLRATVNTGAVEMTPDLSAGREALVGLSVLWHSELRLLLLLRELSFHPRAEVRAGVVAAASRVGYRLLLLELLARETDGLLRRILRTVTSFAEASA